ncbi:hypothetical protein NHH03_06625 [Stieleria sp. TO1_6]|uniref:hypothetical protein n=1 Tax=Stieleria tagensis TaxID=2956795 RepID=UPI00209ACC8F|nr:hypothetical protein [Stieleria tagensis]MCO8121405.1 hypothetical protein [Stieleria tagensis]
MKRSQSIATDRPRAPSLRWFASVMNCVMILMIVTGCESGLSTGYGSSQGFLAERSVNGFTTLRQSFVSAGFETHDLNRLTRRARQTSVVVWTPEHPSGIESKTTAWFDRWLRMGSKTLIYVIPDSGSESAYYRLARPNASAEQRFEYRRKHAESLIAEHRWQLQRGPLPSNGWFAALPKVQQSGERRFEWILEPFATDNVAHQGAAIWKPAGPGSASWTTNNDLYSPSPTDVELNPILQTDSGDTVVAKISSAHWHDSQVLVVAGGSLLTNFGLIQTANQTLADDLIQRSLQTLIDSGTIDRDLRLSADKSEPLVGFSKANVSIPISEVSGEIPRASGAEILTVFPISFVTIHIALLGLVICLMLMPIFGRPRHVDRGVLTHFGDHLDAVGTLMRRSGGELFAKRRISDYMKRVRGETAGPWVIDEPHPTVKKVELDDTPDLSAPPHQG